MDQILEQLGIPATYGRSPELPRYAEPEELVDVGPNIIGREQRLTPKTARAWIDMKSAAADDSIELLIVSGFRGIDDQVRVIANKLKAGQDIGTILKVNTAPGFSQHHTGRAIDVATTGVRPLIDAFADSAAFRWLEAHAGRFGFVMPYDRDNEWGLSYEPWHWFYDQD